MYQKTILNNGLRLITHSMPHMESVAIGIWIRIGGRYESEDIKGISHFLEHLVFKGSRKYSCRFIKEAIEGIGGALNAFTSEESTCYFAKLPAGKQFQALDILLDMSLNPILKQSDIERERLVILEEIKMYRDLPQSHVNDILDQLLWPGHPLGSPIIGSKNSLSSLRREDLLAFQKRTYAPCNIVVAACGKVRHGKILERLKAFLRGRCTENNKNAFPAVAEYGQGPKIKILYKKTAQTHLVLGCYGLRRDHPAKNIISLLNVIMGGNMSSRLFSEVREKRGLAYQIGTQAKGLMDTGAFLVRAGVDNSKVVPAVEVIIRELDRIKKTPVSMPELRRAKEFYIGQIRLALDDTLEHMLWIGEPTLHLNKTYNLKNIIKEVRKIGPADIRRLAREIFSSGAMRLAAIGPLRKEEKGLYACVGKL